MNAVNLLPARPRARVLGVTASAPFLGLLGGLVVVLLATVLYVSEDNRVSARQATLDQLTPGVARWTAAANSYSRFTSEAQQHGQELSDVRQLVISRFDWGSLLDEIAALMPTDAQLSSVQASTPAAAAQSATATGTSTGSGSAIQLSACATSQSAVAQTMVQLRRVPGIASVVLSSSSAGSSTSGTTATPTGSGECSLPVQFQLSLSYAQSAAGAAAPAAAGGATTSTS